MRTFLLFLFFVLMMISGCVSIPDSDRMAALERAKVPIEFTFKLRPDASLRRTNGVWRLATHRNTIDVPLTRRGDSYVVQALRAEWMSLESMHRRHAQGAPSESGIESESLYLKIREQQFLVQRVTGPNGLLFELDPSPPANFFPEYQPVTGGVWRLSKFAYLHSVDETLLLESPMTSVRVRIHHRGLVALLLEMTERTTGSKLLELAVQNGLATSEAGVFLTHMALSGFIVPCCKGDLESKVPISYWEFHDLLFHARSLQGRHAYQMGGTYRLRDSMPAPPVVKPPVTASRVALPAIGLILQTKLNRPFGKVLSERRSIREQGEKGITLAELSAFLQTAARIQSFENPSGEEELSNRPSPSGGARHPLEIYLLINRCEGLQGGFYHYRPDTHELEKLEIPGKRRAEFIALNPFNTWSYPPPQVLLLISARYARTAWKYEGLAYRVIQNDLGCLEQTMYLAATALDLAPCVIGNVDPVLFAEATGIDYYEEPLLAAFTLNSK